MAEFLSLSLDPRRFLEFARQAVSVRSEPASVRDQYLATLERRLTGGECRGGVWAPGGRAKGAAWWERAGPSGVAVELVYLEPGAASRAGYGELLDGIESSAGPILFVSGPLPHLEESEESSLMTGRGYARYARSEMQWPPDATAGPSAVGGGPGVRPVEPTDSEGLARLHLAAYRGTFDQYLFREVEDEEADARRHIRDIVSGRWGPFLPGLSRLATENGELVAAVLTVRRPEGVLLVDVMVDPDRQHQGLGRAVLGATVRALSAQGERHIVLNVTEGNGRAVRLYRGLGFVRSMGPTQDWFNTRRIPGPFGLG